MAKNLALQRGVIIDYDGGGGDKDRVYFLIPDTVQESKSAQWNSIEIMGRHEPITTYSYSNHRTMNLSPIYFPVSMNQSDQGEARQPIDDVNFIRSFTFPDYSTSAFTRPPHRMVIVIGTWLRVMGVLESYEVNWQAQSKAGWNVEGGLSPMVIEISLQVRLFEEAAPVGQADVKAGRDLQQATSSSSGGAP